MHWSRHLWGIKEYYDFISKEELKLEANAMIGERYYHLLGKKRWAKKR